jgi:pantetheine-phosphate adenylyltransferase
MTIAVYAGSFDPVTKGHLDLIYRAARQFEKLIIGVGVNSKKAPLFDQVERMALISACVKENEQQRWSDTPANSEESVDGTKVEVWAFQGLLVDFCAEHKATAIVRGLRAVTDFEQELGIAQANMSMAPDIDTFFLPTRSKFMNVSSSVVREIASHNSETGWRSLQHYVNEPVLKALRAKHKHVSV